MQRYTFFLICANFGAWKSQNNEIFGEERGFGGVICRDQISTQGTKKSGKYYLPVKEERGKREQGGVNCRKYATEMKNEQDNRQLLLIFMLFICIYAKKIVILQPILKCVYMRIREKDRKR